MNYKNKQDNVQPVTNDPKLIARYTPRGQSVAIDIYDDTPLVSTVGFEATSFGRCGVKYTRVGIKLTDYVRYLSFEGQRNWPVTGHLTGGAVSFQMPPIGLSGAVYGVTEAGVPELLVYTVDSSD